MSPQTHYFLAALFREAGFPPGVINFVLHRPQDAAEIYECMIQHPAVKKCNFTGSTQVGRVIASKAAMALKPVLLELGGKNPVVVLEDADLDQAADEIVAAGYLNVSICIYPWYCSGGECVLTNFANRMARSACRLISSTLFARWRRS